MNWQERIHKERLQYLNGSILAQLVYEARTKNNMTLEEVDDWMNKEIDDALEMVEER